MIYAVSICAFLAALIPYGNGLGLISFLFGCCYALHKATS